MSEVVIYRHPERNLELVFDTDDVASFSSPRDAYPVTCEAQPGLPDIWTWLS